MSVQYIQRRQICRGSGKSDLIWGLLLYHLEQQWYNFSGGLYRWTDNDGGIWLKVLKPEGSGLEK